MPKLPIFQKGQRASINFLEKNKSYQDSQLIIFFGGIIFVFVVLIVRLFQLTIVKGSYYQRLAETNRIRETVIEPERGSIIDRKGFVLAKNIPADINKSGERLTSGRLYFSPEAISQIVGYRQLADNNDISGDLCLNKLKNGDKTGKKGVEKTYDCELRGKPGKKLIEVDARGKYLNTISILSPQKGQTIQLAIDLELQKKAYDLLNSELHSLGKDFAKLNNIKASIIGLKPRTGEVIILVSSPAYNPQDFENNTSNIEKYFLDEDKPMFNRATEGIYPPGSVFKPIIAAAALEENKITSKTIVEDHGFIKAGSQSFGNWYYLQYGKTEGQVNIVKAIQRSNDIFFYKTGGLLGPDLIKIWAEKFGLGKKTNIDIDESEGMIPSSFWKEEMLKDRWYLGDTYNLSIGQGYLQVTPLQIAQTISVFANDGYYCKPQLLKNKKPDCDKLPISDKNLQLIQEGLKQACQTGGTGWPLFEFKVRSEELKISQVKEASESAKIPTKKIEVACKTGTAESHSLSGLPHAWFTAYAPSINPELILTVMIEEVGQGSDLAAPIAREIFKKYFERSE